MRRLLISTAVLAFLATPAFAQPDNPHRDGRASDRAEAQQGVPAQPGGGHDRGGDRGGNRGPAQAPVAAPAAAAQPQATDRGNWRGRDNRGAVQAAAPAAAAQPQAADRGNWQDRRGAVQATAPAAAAQPQATQNRGNWQGQNGQNNGRDFNRPDYRGGNNFSNRDNRGFGNRTAPRRDYSNFRDFHRSFNASRRFQAPAYRRPAGWYSHRWSFGEFLPAAFWARDYWLSDYGRYYLPPPPYGAVWVRVGSDALLVDEDSGEVITVEYGIFY